MSMKGNIMTNGVSKKLAVKLRELAIKFESGEIIAKDFRESKAIYNDHSEKEVTFEYIDNFEESED